MITIEEIRKYEQTHYTLTKLCVLWASKNLADWQHYQGWNLIKDVIYITYSYTDYYCNTEMITEFDDISIPLDEFLKECEELCK